MPGWISLKERDLLIGSLRSGGKEKEIWQSKAVFVEATSNQLTPVLRFGARKPDDYDDYDDYEDYDDHD